jgi:hypothetical protein
MYRNCVYFLKNVFIHRTDMFRLFLSLNQPSHNAHTTIKSNTKQYKYIFIILFVSFVTRQN